MQTRCDGVGVGVGPENGRHSTSCAWRRLCLMRLSRISVNVFLFHVHHAYLIDLAVGHHHSGPRRPHHPDSGGIAALLLPRWVRWGNPVRLDAQPWA